MDYPDYDKAWCIRTCAKDNTSHGGFKWPTEVGATVKCDDWDAEPECGNGLHGLLDGFGDYSLLSDAPDAIWQIVLVDRYGCVELNGKVKFANCELVFVGNMATVMTMMAKYQINLMLHAADASDASGNGSQLAASGDGSQLAASGDRSQLAASGYRSQLAASGDRSQLAASGYRSKLAASGYRSKLAASGDRSQLAASGDGSKLAASGDGSKLAASGYRSKLAASGNRSVAICCGRGSIAMAGNDGCIALTWFDEDKNRYRVEVAYVGENGIKPNVYYRLNNEHRFEEVP